MIEKIVIANSGEKGDRQVPLHLVEETPIVTNCSSINEVSVIKSEGDFPVMVYISQQGLKHRAISLVIAHDGEGKVVGVSHGNPCKLTLVPVVHGHGGIGIPQRDPDECEDTERGQDYLDRVFFKNLLYRCNESSHSSAFLSEFMHILNLS
jgi:hypothetical protein